MAKGPNALLMIAGSPKGMGGKKPMPGEDEDGSPEARAGEAFGRAVQSGDGAAIARTYKALKRACEMSEGGDSSPEAAEPEY